MRILLFQENPKESWGIPVYKPRSPNLLKAVPIMVSSNQFIPMEDICLNVKPLHLML